MAQFVGKFGIIFYFFGPGAQSNEDRKTLQAQTWLVRVKLLPHAISLNLENVCHLGELDSTKNYSKIIDFSLPILATADKYD